MLRIDVDKKENGKNYAIPKDNPFVGLSRRAAGDLGLRLRNLWRMAFDKKTGRFWAGEVGQNLYEEIILDREGRQLRLEPPRVVPPVRAEGSGCAQGIHRADLGVPPRRGQVDHRRDGLSRLAAAGAGRVVPLCATTSRRRSGR